MQISRYTSYGKLNDDNYFLINGLSGAIDIVDRPVIDLILAFQKGVSSHDRRQQEIISALKERGHLTSKTTQEEFEEAWAFFKNLFRWFSQDKKLHIIVPSYKCNLRCKYCFQSHLLVKGEGWLEKVMTEREVEAVFRAIGKVRGSSARDTRPIHLYGGEPLLPEHKGIIRYILERGSKLGYSFYVVTNGVHLEQYIPVLKHFPIQGIQVTIDGVKSVHDTRRVGPKGEGTFDTIVENVEKARKAGFRLSIRTCVDASNIKHMPLYAEFVRSMGWHKDEKMIVYIAPVRRGGICYRFFPWDVSPSEMTKVSKNNDLLAEMFYSAFHFMFKKTIGPEGEWIPQFYYCDAIFSQIFYDAHGHVYTCTESLGDPALKIGTYTPTLKFDALYELWRSRNVFNLERCKQCRNALLCGGGCPYHAYSVTGSIMQSDCTSFALIRKHYFSHMIALYFKHSKYTKKFKSWSN